MNLIGHSSPSFCHDAIEATAEAVEEGGFRMWEIVAEAGHDVWGHRRRFQDVLPSHRLKVQVHAPISDCNLGSLLPVPWRHALATVERSLRGAAAIGARRVTLHPGNHTPLSRGHYDRLHEQTRAALRRLDRLGEDLGLDLLLENMPTGWAFETDSVPKLLDLVEGTSLNLCYDVGHAFVAGRMDEFEEGVRRIRNVHIHDNRGDHDAHLTLGDGKTPWERTVKRLARAGYRHPFVVESQNHASGNESLRLLHRELSRHS